MKKVISIVLACAMLLYAGAPLAFAAEGPTDTLAAAFNGTVEEGTLFSALLDFIYRAYSAYGRAYAGILCRISAQQHLEHNRAFDQAFYEDGRPVFITGQHREPVPSMLLGTKALSQNGCGLIMVYNVLLEFGKHKDLSKIIYDFERAGALGLEGELGTKEMHCKKYLEDQGLKVTAYRNAGALDEIRKGGDVFAVSYRNWGSLSAHIIMVKQVDGQMAAYNTYGGPFDSFEQLLEREGSYQIGFKIAAA